MLLPARVRDIPAGPIDALNARARSLRASGASVISLGQAVPDLPPPEAALERARQALSEPDTHVYSPDAGLASLREAWSAVLAEESDLHVDPARELLLTAGGNQAFMIAALTLLEPGDRVLLPAPVYFNHAMAVRLVGAVPVEVPLRAETGFQLRFVDLEPFLDPAPRALVLVSPNNPTGAVYDAGELVHIGREMAARGVVMIADETYRYFCYDGATHSSLAAGPGLREHVITLGSFSKTFSITGWRLGYMLGPAAFIDEALKVQDTLAICASVIAQKAVLGALPGLAAESARRRAILSERRDAFARHVATVPRLHWTPTRGALFGLVRVDGCRDSAQLARDLLEKVHVVAIPGSVFGPSGEGYLRLSYGSADVPTLDEAFARLGRYFGG